MSGVNVRIPSIKRNNTEKADGKKVKVEEPDIKYKLSNEAVEILKKMEKVDTNEKFYNIEDKIAIETGHDAIYEQYMAESSVMREAITDYINGKKIDPNQHMIPQQAKMKRLARLSHYATAQLRKNVQAQLEALDAKLLQLQNVTSEVQHIEKEIDRCLDYSGGDEDIDLIPVEQFYKEAPESISNPEVTKQDEHLQRLARLQFESDQRKQKQATLSELEGRRNVLVSDIRGKEQKLQSLKPKIEALVKAAGPVQDLLGVKYKDVEIEENQKQLVLSLPTKLAILHTHATAYKDVMADKSIDILIVESIDNSKTEKEEAEVKRKRKKDETVEDRIEDLADKIFEAHPMSIRVDIQCPKNDIKVSLHFQYLLELKVTTLKWEIEGIPKSKNSSIMNEELLLCNLFDDDSGDTCPEAVGDLKMKQLKLSFDSVAKTVGKPYKFVQILSGATDKHETAQLTEYFRKVVNSIRERVDDRLSLSTIIKSLESRKTDKLELPEDNEIKISLFRYCDDENIDVSSIPSTMSAAIAASKVSERFLYKADFEDSQQNILTAFVSIPCNYPKSSAIIGLTTTTEGCEEPIKQIEESLNVMDDPSTTVQKQIGKIIQNFDFVFSKG